MNSKKYKNDLYEMREISDLKDLLNSSAELFANDDAFLEKNKITKKFVPISYAQFKVDVNALGTGLCELGLKGKKIAIIGENSYSWVVTYFAVVNGTGIVVPIDRELKTKEIVHLLNRAEVECVVHSKRMKNIVEEAREHIPTLKYVIEMDLVDDEEKTFSFERIVERGKLAIDEGNNEFVNAVIDREAPCAILFTSGTTGMAKGVMLSHKNITSNVYNMSKYVKIVSGGVGLSILPMHHTYEMTCHVLTGLYQGMAIAICEGLKYIVKNMQEVRPTVMLAVPLIFETIYKKIWKQAKDSGKANAMEKMLMISKKTKLYNRPFIVKRMFKPIHELTGGRMEQFIAGGAAMNPEIIDGFEAMGFPMFQGYGMTENSPIVAVNKDRYSKSKSVGLPMPGTEIKIINPDETGMGEIIIKGPSVMVGYYNNEKATKEAIVDDWLYTGDYGYFDDEGFLYISGRKKNVIVTKNGKNIFPEELEFNLCESEFIEEAIVTGEENGRNGDTIVKAFIYPCYPLLKLEKDLEEDEEIKDFISLEIDKVNANIPSYKMIKRFEIRKEEFEKTTTRKIKRFNRDSN